MKRYFVVDDSQDVEELLKLLSKRGISVTEARGDGPGLFPSVFACRAADVSVARETMGASADTDSGVSEDQALAQQKRIAEELCQANLVVENSPVVLFRWRAEEGWPVELVSDNITRFGYSREELLSGTVSFSSLVHPDDLKRVASEVEEYSAAGIDSFQQEYRIVARNGAEYWVDDRTIVERDAAGAVTHYQGIVIDITERKQAEQELVLSKFCLDNAGIGIFHTFEQQIFNANEHACRNLGYSVEELRSMRVSDIDPVITDEKMHEIRRALETTGSVTHQTVHRRKDGTTYPVEITANQFEFLGKHHGISFVKDISDRMRAEEALRLSEDRLRSIFLVAPIGIGVVRDRVLQEVNHRLCNMVGYTQEELVGRTARMLYPDRDEFERVGREKYRQIAENGTGVVETRWQKKDGAIIDILLASTPMDPADLLKGVTFTALDITERKKAEKALRESEEKFRVLAETSPAGISLYQGEKIVYANSAVAQMFGFSVEELLDMSFWECAHEDYIEMVRERGRARLRGESVPNQYECKFVTKAGESFWAIVSGGCIEYRGKLAGIVTLIDITEAKRAEERMHASLAEKTVLLQEVHHRVKNNLQIVSSLLELQLDSIPDEESRRFIRESRNRITSMALVHEKLYRTENFSSIKFADYLQSLSEHLLHTLAKDPNLITITVDIGDFSLSVDDAIPCGLIINELVSNSLKHAFPPDSAGAIIIRCHVGAGGRVALMVADTGLGMSPDLDFRKTESLGLQLVTMLVRQLRGELEMSLEGGTSWKISFTPS